MCDEKTKWNIIEINTETEQETSVSCGVQACVCVPHSRGL